MARFGTRFGEFVAKTFLWPACLAVVGLLPTAPVLAQTQGAFEVHYAPEENLEAIDAGLIGEARTSVDVMAYLITDRTVFGALEGAAARGVKVRIWRDGRMAAEIGEADLTPAPRILRSSPGLIRGPGIEMRTSHGAEFMHLKGYCVDGALLRTGSANFSHSGERYQDNDLVILRAPNACAGFEAKFERAWDSAK